MLQLRWMRGWNLFLSRGNGMLCNELHSFAKKYSSFECPFLLMSKKSWLVAISDRKFCFCSTLDLSYRNRYNLNYRPNASFNFCEISKSFWFWHVFKKFTKPLQEFPPGSRMVHAVSSWTFFSKCIFHVHIQ